MSSFDPQAPFVDKAGLRYADFGEWMAGRPERSYRNVRVAMLRADGASDEAVDKWIERHERGEHTVIGSCPEAARTFSQALYREANKSEFIVSIVQSMRAAQGT